MDHLLARPKTLTGSLEFHKIHLSLSNPYAITDHRGGEDCPPHPSKFVGYTFFVLQLSVPTRSLSLRIMGELTCANLPQLRMLRIGIPPPFGPIRAGEIVRQPSVIFPNFITPKPTKLAQACCFEPPSGDSVGPGRFERPTDRFPRWLV